jgi:hypothetical protein
MIAGKLIEDRSSINCYLRERSVQRWMKGQTNGWYFNTLSVFKVAICDLERNNFTASAFVKRDIQLLDGT